MYRKTYSEQLAERDSFLLNMQILADAFEDRYQILEFSPGGNQPTLKSIRHYRNGTTPSIGSVYILWAFQVNESFINFQNVSLIIIGDIDKTLLSPTTSYLILSENTDINNVYDYTTDVFMKYATWDLALHQAYHSANPLHDMIKVSLPIFENPMFVHDNDFYVLTCPNKVAGMLEWMIDSRNGRPMVPLELINAFKIDEEYLHTLRTHGGDIFSANQRGYRILYINLWNGSHYEGRICVDEIQTLIKPGHFLAIEYLAKIILNFITHRNVFWTSMGHDAEELCRKVLDRTITDERDILRTLRFLNWTPDDQYLIIKLRTGSASSDSHFTTGTFGYIESQIIASHAFFYDQSIVVIVNQTVGKASTAQIISDLAYLSREGLFKMGVSNEIHNFFHIHTGYEQASIALEYGLLSESTSWCYRFKDYALDYMLNKACEDLSSNYLCCKEIGKLIQYDEEHNTKLSETLETYLNLERNIVQTAKALFIHRSTLFYRLDRIGIITNLNLDDAKTRLYLQLSYQIMKSK